MCFSHKTTTTGTGRKERNATRNPTKRKEQLLERLAADGRADVAALAEHLGVCSMTVRRDIESLEHEGRVLRTPGGCMLRQSLVAESSFAVKERRQREQKHAIALEAARLLNVGMSLYIDTGTTCLSLARVLPLDRRLQVFTNNLRVAGELFGRSDLEVFLFGGRLADRNPDLIGDYAIQRIGRQRFDIAFIGADALDPKTGQFFAADLATALMAETAMLQAGRAVALIDSSKIGKRSLSLVGRLGPEMTLITDFNAAPAARAALRRTGAELLVAPRATDRLASKPIRRPTPQENNTP